MNPASLQLDSLLLAVKEKGSIIDEQLIIRQRFSLYWVWLKVTCPIYWLFGVDAFSHVKAVRVAQSVFNFWKDNQLEGNPEETQKVLKLLESLRVKTHHDYTKDFDELTSPIYQNIYIATMHVALTSFAFWKTNHSQNPEETEKLFNLLESLKDRNHPDKKRGLVFLTLKMYQSIIPNIDDPCQKIESQDRAILSDKVIQRVFKILLDVKNDTRDPQEKKIRRFISKEQSHLPIDVRVYFDREKRGFPHIFLDLKRPAYRRETYLSFDLANGKYYQRRVVSQSEKSLLSKYISLTEKTVPTVVSIAPNAKVVHKVSSYTLYQMQPDKTLDSYLTAPLTLAQKIKIIRQLFDVVEMLHSRGHAHLNIHLDSFAFKNDIRRNPIVIFEDLRSVDRIDEMVSDSTRVHPDLFLLRAKLITIESEDLKSRLIADFRKQDMQSIDVWDLGIVLSIILLEGYVMSAQDTQKWFIPKIKSIANLYTALSKNETVDFDLVQTEIDRDCKEISNASKKISSAIYENKEKDIQNPAPQQLQENVENSAIIKRVISKTIDSEYHFLVNIWDLVFQMLKVDGKKRISAQDLHNKFQEIMSKYDLSIRDPMRA